MESVVVWQSSKLVAFSCLLQFVEYWCLRSEFSVHGLWRGSRFSPDWTRAVFSYPVTLGVLTIGLGASILHLIFSDVATVTILFAAMMYMVARFRGPFNGGSDAMTVLVLATVMIALGFSDSPMVVRLALLYLAVQVVLSYVVAGFVKLKNPDWRSGRALSEILLYSNYPVPAILKSLARSRGFAVFGSWAVIVFECTFVAVLFVPVLVVPLLALSFLFHIFNVYVFGLNRFVYAWLAAYPVVYYVALR